MRRRSALSLVVSFACLLPLCPEAFAQPRQVNPVELANDGWAAIQEQRYGDALRDLTAASEQLPDEAVVWLGRGVAAYMLGRDDDAARSFEQALSLDPETADASRLLGELYYRTGRIEEAIDTYEAALKRAADRDLSERLDTWKREHQVTDRFRESSARHFRILFEGRTDDGLARQIVAMLETAYRDVGNALRTYPSQPITVVLYTQAQFQDITRAPEWATGVFDGQIRIPARGALDRRAELARVLTHEYVHALVATVGGRTVPMWVHEGMATVFEPGGLDDASVTLAAAGSRPSLQDLHGSFAGLSGGHARIAYAQSAVAVDRMLDLRGAPAVMLMLKDLARGVPFETAFHRRIGLWYDEFVRIARNLR